MSPNQEESSEQDESNPGLDDSIHIKLGNKYMKMLNNIANSHYNGNRSLAVRRGIHRLKSWQDLEDDLQRTQEKILSVLSDILELVKEIHRMMEALTEEIENLENSQELPSDAQVNTAEEAADEVYYVLKEADRPLTVVGIEERADQPVTKIQDGLDKLLDEQQLVEKISDNGSDSQYFGVYGMDYNRGIKTEDKSYEQ